MYFAPKKSLPTSATLPATPRALSSSATPTTGFMCQSARSVESSSKRGSGSSICRCGVSPICMITAAWARALHNGTSGSWPEWQEYQLVR